MLLRRALPLAVTGSLAWAASAQASILVSALPKSVSCASGLKPGVYFKPVDDGPRDVTIGIKNAAGKTVSSRKVKARSDGFHFYRYRGRCGATYTVTYGLPGGVTDSYRVRIRP